MNSIEERVTRCFSNVFPDLREEEIPQASMERLASWDSVAHVTLLSSLAEEFGHSFELEDFEELTSFPNILHRLEKEGSNG